jgi:hypothetical protein
MPRDAIAESTSRPTSSRAGAVLYNCPAALLEKAALSRDRDGCGRLPRALPSWALPGVMLARILVVLDDAKICLDMLAAHRAPLQRDDVVHDMHAPSGPRHEFCLAVDFDDGILVCTPIVPAWNTPGSRPQPSLTSMTAITTARIAVSANTRLGYRS